MSKRLFISYSHADAGLLDRLHKHLAPLQREGSLAGWYDRDIRAGTRLDDEIRNELSQADVFVACVSPDYLASNYCYERELAGALQREEKRELAIVPIIFEASDWLSTPLAKFKAVPTDGKPISAFTNQNVAFLEVVSELRRLAITPPANGSDTRPSNFPANQANLSRYRVKREFDALAKRDFVEAAFNEVYKFFEASANEIASIPDIDVRLSPLSQDHFSCTVMNRGISRGFETIHVRRGGNWGAIDILYGENNANNTSNGGFGVKADDYQLFLTPSMFRFSHQDERISTRDAAQMLWDELLSKVGVDYA